MKNNASPRIGHIPLGRSCIAASNASLRLQDCSLQCRILDRAPVKHSLCVVMLKLVVCRSITHLSVAEFYRGWLITLAGWSCYSHLHHLIEHKLTPAFCMHQVKDHKREVMEMGSGTDTRLYVLEQQQKAAAEASSTAGTAGGEEVKKALKQVEGLQQVRSIHFWRDWGWFKFGLSTCSTTH